MNINPVKNALIKYNSLKHNLTFIQKKNRFSIIDGYINYNIDTTNLTCPCSKFLCEHLIYFLTKVIRIDIYWLVFFNLIKKELISILQNNTNIEIINTKINNFIVQECECIICMCSIIEKKFNNAIIECSNCYHYCHKYCYDLYKTKNGLITNTCIYCKSGTMF